MKPNEFESLFENCLARLQHGEDLEIILAEHPEQAAALRPLLQTVINLQALPIPAPVPAKRNPARAHFLASAGERRPKPAGRPTWRPIRTLVTSLFLLIVLLTSLLGTGLASAQALPGDTLYPVKRAVEKTRLALTSTSLERLKLEESFDQQRTLEAAKLVESSRGETVYFHGTLQQSASGWQVGSLAVYPSDPGMDWNGLAGAQVEVIGTTRPDGVKVEELQLRLFHLGGVIEQVGDLEWLVSGVPVDLSPATRLVGEAQTGASVTITAIQLQAGRFLALSIQVSSPQVLAAAEDEETIYLSDWAALTTGGDSDSSDGEDHSGSSGKNSSGSSSDDSEKTPKPEKTDDSD